MHTPHQGMMRINPFRRFATMIKKSGASPDRVLERANLPPALLERQDTALLTLPDLFNVWREAVWATDDPLLGARAGARAEFVNLPIYGPMVADADTLADACRRGTALFRLLATRADAGFHVKKDRAFLSLNLFGSGNEGRHQVEMVTMGYTLSLLRDFLGASWSSGVAHIPGLEESQIPLMEQIFNLTVSNRGRLPCIEFDACLLATPADRRKSGAQETQVPFPPDRDLLVPETGAGTMEAIASILLLEGNPRIFDVATRMGMSVRTAQRMLKAEKTSYSAILDKLKARRSFELMQSGMSLANVAFQLGYSDQAHFSRAFSRWAGLPPGRFLALSRQLQARRP